MRSRKRLDDLADVAWWHERLSFRFHNAANRFSSSLINSQSAPFTGYTTPFTNSNRGDRLRLSLRTWPGFTTGSNVITKLAVKVYIKCDKVTIHKVKHWYWKLDIFRTPSSFSRHTSEHYSVKLMRKGYFGMFQRKKHKPSRSIANIKTIVLFCTL